MRYLSGYSMDSKLTLIVISVHSNNINALCFCFSFFNQSLKTVCAIPGLTKRVKYFYDPASKLSINNGYQVNEKYEN